MALGGLMSFLKDVAVSPVGQIAGGAMEQKVMDWQEEARIKEEADARKAQFADALALKKAELGLVDDADALERENAYTHFADAGVNEKILAEMKRAGWFLRAQNSSEGVYNTLIGAEAFYGKDFWRNPESKGWKAIMEIEPISATPDAKIDGLGENAKKLLLTEDSAKVHPDVKVLPKKTGITAESFYTGPISEPLTGADIEQRKVFDDLSWYTDIGFSVDTSKHFRKDPDTGALTINWSKFVEDNPGAKDARLLFERLGSTVRSVLQDNRGGKQGYEWAGDLQNTYGWGEHLNIAGSIKAVGNVLSEVMQAVNKEGHAHAFLDKMRDNISTNKDYKHLMPAQSNEEMIEILNEYNPNWIDTLKNISAQHFSKQGLTPEELEGIKNPFKDTPFDHIFSDSKNIPIVNTESLEKAGEQHQKRILHDETDPRSYEEIQQLHNKYYGESATRRLEGSQEEIIPKVDSLFGRPERPVIAERAYARERNIEKLVPPLPYSDKDLLGRLTEKRKEEQEAKFSILPETIKVEESILQDTLNYKRLQIEGYAPLKDLGNTASVLLSGTELGSFDALKELGEKFPDLEDFEKEIQLVLLRQQQDGKLPKFLTLGDIEMLSKKTSEDYLFTSYMKQENSSYVGDRPIKDNIAGVDTGAEDITSLDEAEKKDTYTGERNKEGQFHGQGTMTFANGDTYVGEYQNGKQHGQGTKTYADGETYVGEFSDGERHGQGTYAWASGGSYVGEWRDGLRHGQGTYTSADGRTYVGEYRDGKRYGQGTDLAGDKPWLLEDGSFNPKFSNTLITSSNFKEEWEGKGFDFNEYKKAKEDWSEGKTKKNLEWFKDLFKSGEASAAENPRFKEKK